MPCYKLCYFNARGLGEMCRLLFAEKGMEYEDKRVLPEEWPELKNKMPFKQMPVLYVDDVAIPHSRAAFRFLAREFGLLPSSSVDQALLDCWVEILFEAFKDLPFSEKDKDKQAQKVKEVMESTVNLRFEVLTNQIQKTEGPYMFGEFTAGDIVVYSVMEFLIKKFGLTLEDYPAIDALQKAVAERKNIKAWIANRPVTEN